MNARNLLHLLAMSALVLTAVPLAACGGDAPTSSRPRRAKTKTKKKKGPAPGEIDQSKIPPKLRNIDWKKIDGEAIDLSRGIRDPFEPHVDDLLKGIEEGAGGEDGELLAPIPEPVGGLALIAIITGTAVHKAMVVDKEGVGHIVRAGEIVGKPPMRIVRITRNEVLFKALTPPENPEEKEEEVRKVLLTQAELEELLP